MRLPPRFPKSGYAITLCVLVTLATAAPLWPSELKITYLANEGVLLDCQGKKVLIDALFRDSLDDYMRHPPEVQEKLETGKPPFDGVGLALATHFHLDHWDAGAISRFLVNNPGAVFASTPQATAMLPHSLQGRVRALWPDKDHDVGLKMSGIQVDAFALEHGKTQNLGYRLLVCSEVVFHLGDAGASDQNFKPVLQAGHTDVAMVPFWWLLDSKSTAFIKDKWKPKHVVALHLGATDKESGREIQTHWPNAWVCTKQGEARTF
ncbi:MAG: MBL fold metallo-hydrolase [Acidobacteriia bacterium]|nr:MBL fold metallo-hydrolase [Terriglobia bacterium]